MTNDESVWKKRFAIFAALRVSGLAIFFFGMLTIFSDLIRPDGFLELGLAIVGLGLAEALLGPVLLKRTWDKDNK